MMTRIRGVPEGIEVEFADGLKGIVPYTEIPEVNGLSDIADVELPNLYVAILHTNRGETVELPWDFARHYCDASYRPRVESLGAAGRQEIGSRIRELREGAGLTQEALATAAGIGRVTLVRIENGEQSPRYETLVSLATALGQPLRELLVGGG
jgi:DNA-binding XRE family transcriptional regulator